MKQHLILVLFLLSYVIGCSSEFPPDWPKMYPCKITVTQNGAPVEGVDVTLVRTANHGYWAVFGRSDVNGKVEIETAWTKAAQKGAPEGTFKVTFFKPLEKLNDPTSEEQLAKMDYLQRKAHEDKLYEQSRKRKPALPTVFSSETTTPVEIEVGPGKQAEFSINLDEYAKK